jgi:hypothetical protein
MRSARLGGFVALLTGLACASKSPPPPVIETQAAEIGGRQAEREQPAETTEPRVGKLGQQPAPEPAASAEPGPISDQPQITLLEAGTEPRRVLRHKFKKGARQQLTMHSTTNVSGSPMPLPPFSLDAPLETTITEVNRAGDAKFSFRAGPFKTRAQGGGGLGALLGGLGASQAPERVAGWGWMTPQGVVREQHVTEGMQDGDAPVETGDPFPAEAIGVGARWRVRLVLAEKGKNYRQTSHYELLELGAKSIKTKLSRVQESLAGADQPVAQSSGELDYTFGQIYPTGRLSMMRDVELPIPGAEQLGLKMSSEVTIKKK